MKRKNPPPLLLLILVAVLTLSTTLNTYAVVDDNVGTSNLDLRVGEYSDTADTHTLFGLLKSILNELADLDGNLDSLTVQLAAFFGFGKQGSIPSEDNFSQASMVEKFNYLEKQNETLITGIQQLDTKVSAVNRSTATMVYANSQIRSVNATKTGPTSIMVHWDCTKDTDCLNNSQNPEGIDISTIKGFTVYYSDIDASAKHMIKWRTLNLDASKSKTWDYSCVIEGLNPNTQYYVWVTSVLDDGFDTELSDTSDCQITRTTTVSQAAAENVTALPKDATVLRVSWTDGLTGVNEKSDFVDHYNVYYDTEILNVSNVLECSNKVSVSECEATLSGLSIGEYYYIAVVPIMKDAVAGSIVEDLQAIYASTKLSENGGELVFVDLDNDGVDESVLCTIVFGNTGQISGQTQETLDGLVDAYFEKTDGTYYSEGLRSLIKEDGKQFHLLTTDQIDVLLAQGKQDIEFVGENLAEGVEPNIAYVDTTQAAHAGYYNSYGLTCSAYDPDGGYVHAFYNYSGTQRYYDGKELKQLTWSGCSHPADTYSTPSVKVGLVGYFDLSDLQGY